MPTELDEGVLPLAPVTCVTASVVLVGIVIISVGAVVFFSVVAPATVVETVVAGEVDCTVESSL